MISFISLLGSVGSMTLFIETNLKSKAVMYIKKLHHFSNSSPSDDDPMLDRKYLGKD